MGAIFEVYAYAILIGVIAIASAASYILKLIGIGDHGFVAGAIGFVLGAIIVLISPTGYIASFIVAGVASIVSNIILTQIW